MFGSSTSQALPLFAGPWLLPMIQALRHNSYGTPSLVSDVLCTRLQLFLLHGLKQTAGALSFAVHVSELTLHMTLVGDKFLELDGSRVHVINTVDDIECAFCVIQTRSNPECSPQRSAAVLVVLSPGSTVDPHSNCRGAELQFQAVDVN